MGRCSAVGRFPGDFGAVVGVGPGDGAEGCPLLWGAQDAHCIAGLERQVGPWVWDHLVPSHDGQDGRPGLAPHAEVPYGVSEEATLRLVSSFSGTCPSDSRIHSTSIACEACRSPRRVCLRPPWRPPPGDGGVEFAPYAVGEGLGFFRCDPEAGEGLARQLQASLQLRLHRLVDAQAAEVFELPGARPVPGDRPRGPGPAAVLRRVLTARASGMVSTTRRALLIPAASRTGTATASP